MDAAELIQRTWDELGYKIRATRYLVFLRTDHPTARTEGGLWIPDTDFYKGMPHQKVVKGTICSAGPKATVKVGDRVVFQRLHFARHVKLEDGTYIGWIDCNQLLGFTDDPIAEPLEQYVAPPNPEDIPMAPEEAAEYAMG